MELRKLERPKYDEIDSSKVFEKFAQSEDKKNIREYLSALNEPQYLYWDKARFKTPPKGFNAVEGWYLAKQIRELGWEETPLKTKSNQNFVFYRRKSDEEYWHRIDMLAGRDPSSYTSISKHDSQRYLQRGLVEEAIASSQLEGAVTTRTVAKQILLEKREPRDRSEIMIVNNYKAMKLLEEDYKGRKLSVDLLLELHRVLTKDDPQIALSARGRLRQDSDEIEVQDKHGRWIAHIPPEESILLRELDRLVAYANDEDGTSFTHPIPKAIFLHFWIGYLHPFTDGNGRIARTLFYWYLLRHGYSMILYLPISTVIRESPDQYADAYVYTEQDDNDLTYFYDYHLRKILQSIDAFEAYIDRERNRNHEIDTLVEKEVDLNDRQKHILHHLLSERADSYVTVQSHAAANVISRLTAQRDLKELETFGYLSSKMVSTYRRYFLTDKLRKHH